MSQPTFAELYERDLVASLFEPWAKLLLDEAKVRAGDRVLDVACGTGIVARLAQRRRATTVVGIDANADMLAVARTLAPELDWRQGSAVALPLRPAEQFDAALCQQGLQFFPDRSAAVREMVRSLAPGGRIAVATWRPVEEAPLLLALQKVAERRLGTLVDQRHAFGDASAVERLLIDCGVHDVRVAALSRTVRFRDAAPFLRLNASALVGMSAAGKAMSAGARALAVDAIVAASTDVANDYTDPTGLAFSIGSLVAVGRV